MILLISEIFWYQNISETHRGSPKNFFGSAGQKKSTENCDIPLLCWNFFDTQKWWNTEGFPHETFLHREKKNSTKSWDYSYPKNFWYRNFSETQKGSPTKMFGTARWKIGNGKAWCTPLMLKDSWYPELVNHYRAPRKKLRYCETKDNLQKFVIPSLSLSFSLPLLPLSTKIFENRSFLKHRGFTYEYIWYCETKCFQQKSVINPYYP